MAHTMQDLSDGVFINMANLNLARRTVTWSTSGRHQARYTCISQDCSTAFEEIRHHEDKHTSGASHRKLQHFHLYSQPPDTNRTLTITSCYVNPHRNLYLLEALHQLLNKNALELVKHQKSLGFYNRLFLVSKPNNRWRPILDLSIQNRFLKTESINLETPETIKTSLQAGEGVTSIDFKDAYFHIQYKVSPESTCIFTSRVSPTSSKHCHLACPQPPWSLQ